VYISLVQVTVREGKEELFLELIRDDAEHSEADEPGCLRFDVLKDTEQPRTFYFYEVYRDEAAHAAHMQTPHLKRIDAMIPELFQGAAVHMLRNVVPGDSAFER
jgi:(4S)-4-hydroxy-5-phosphonooxypentane-2,3-dione isomerase